MIKKFTIAVGLIFFLASNNLLAFRYYKLGDEICPDKIHHVPGQSWQVMNSDWVIETQNVNSLLTQFSADTPVHREVEPYHNILSSKLAVVTCNYQDGTLVLVRTYEEDKGPFPGANYIIADANTNSVEKEEYWPWNHETSCSTSLGSLEKCSWGFYILYIRVYGLVVP